MSARRPDGRLMGTVLAAAPAARDAGAATLRCRPRLRRHRRAAGRRLRDLRFARSVSRTHSGKCLSRVAIRGREPG